MQNTAKPWAGNGSRERTDSMIDVSASKFSTADLNNLMRALEIDVVSLREILVPRGHRVEMEMIDVPAIHYNLKGSGRISISRLVYFATCANRSSSTSNHRKGLTASSARP
jgi:hypothetical protein